MAIDINLNNVQAVPIVVNASLTPELNKRYTVVASATFTDPSPVEGKGFIVFVVNGTATVGGTGYSTAGTIIYRAYHSGAWSNKVYYDKAYFDTIYQAAGTYLTSANITQTITNGVTDKAPSEDAVYDALALKADKSNTVRLFSYNNTTYTYTGATGDTILRTIYIPANTCSANSIVEVLANFTKTGTAGNPVYGVYVGTSASALTGGALVQYILPGATALQSGIWVRLVNKNSLSSQITKGISQVANSLLISQTIPTPSRSFNFSNDLYIHIYATSANASDTQGITDYQCYIHNPA